MADQRIVDLVATLFEKTRTGEISWKKTAEESVFGLPFRNFSVQVEMKVEYDSDIGEQYPTYSISIYDADGEIVETLRPGIFDDKDFAIPKWEVFEKLYEGARRYAMGMNQAVDEILRELLRKGEDSPKKGDDDIPF